MELQNVISNGQAGATNLPESAPPPTQSDGRATADAKAIASDPTPEVPMPIPASPSQSGLVGKASLSGDSVGRNEDSGASAEQRTLKPYGISMLPEKTDTPQQDPTGDSSGE